MEFSTPRAIHQIKCKQHKTLLVDGKSYCALQAMTMALNFHTINIDESPTELIIKGIVPVASYSIY